jgi:hypothetical protein
MIFKHEIDNHRFWYLHPQAIFIMAKMSQYCRMKNRDFVVTSTVSTLREDNKLGRKSSTHREGRAFDVSVQGWSQMFIDEFCAEFNLKYGTIGAVNSKGERRLIVDHKGTARHLHVQLDRSLYVSLVLPQ